MIDARPIEPHSAVKIDGDKTGQQQRRPDMGVIVGDEDCGNDGTKCGKSNEVRVMSGLLYWKQQSTINLG